MPPSRHERGRERSQREAAADPEQHGRRHRGDHRRRAGRRLGVVRRALEGLAAAISSTRPSSDIVETPSPPRLRTAIASRVSRSPQTTTYGIFCSSASRIRLPSVSTRSSTSARTPAAESARIAPSPPRGARPRPGPRAPAPAPARAGTRRRSARSGSPMNRSSEPSSARWTMTGVCSALSGRPCTSSPNRSGICAVELDRAAAATRGRARPSRRSRSSGRRTRPRPRSTSYSSAAPLERRPERGLA